MSLFAMLGLGRIDYVVFIVCNLVGYGTTLFLPPGPWTPYIPILVSYHLFLAWLVIAADHETGLSMPIISTILTHLACIAIVVVLGLGRNVIPFYGIIRYCIPALAPFERTWLFSGGRKKKEVALSPEEAEAAKATAAVSSAATADDYEAWLIHLQQRNPNSVKAGVSIKDEYDQFMVARAKNRPAIAPEPAPVETTTLA
jgi:hypothetical protein